ncbi:MAG: hypothetical protein ABI702_02060 [Burkholderiales bacterium]
MTKLHLDFAHGARRVSRAGQILLIASIGLLSYAALSVGELWTVQSKVTAEAREFDTHRGASSESKARTAKPDPRELAGTKAARQVADNLMTPWASLMSSLGSAATDSVGLLSVEPSVTKHSVRLTAEARDLHEMLVYVGTLQRDARLSSVVLVSHQVQAQAPGTPVRFQVQAAWGEPR